jgi:hypothetical protein
MFIRDRINQDDRAAKDSKREETSMNHKMEEKAIVGGLTISAIRRFIKDKKLATECIILAGNHHKNNTLQNFQTWIKPEIDLFFNQEEPK